MQQRETEKGRKNKKKKNLQKNTKNQTRGKASKTIGQASLLSTILPQCFFFYGGGVPKNRSNLVYVIVEFLVVGMKYLFLQCFLKEAIMDFWGLQS